MIRVAVIGAGHWGPNLIGNFHNHESSEVAWVVDLDGERLKQVKARFRDVQVTDDVSQALRDDRVEAVVVSTPTSTHYGLARQALEHGKHVFVEKPIAADSAQGRELCDRAQRLGRVLLVGHVFLYNPGVRRAKQYIDGGDLGRIYYISMTRTNLGPIRLDVNAAWDLASHDISIANYWLGSTPLKVAAVGGAWINAGIEDTVFVTMRYGSDVIVHLHVSWLNPKKARDITVVGDRKMLTLDDMNLSEPLRIYDKQVIDVRSSPSFVDSFASFRASTRDGDILIPKVALGEPLRLECEHFIDCIANGTKPVTGGEQALAVVLVLEALDESLRRSGQEVEVRA